MFNSNYAVLSLPKHKKHYVLHTGDANGNMVLEVDDIKLSSTLTAICDSYNESLLVVNNLTGEKYE